MSTRSMVAVGLLLLCAACGSSPTAPSPNEVVSLSIEPTNPQLVVGQSMQLSARGTYSDGSTSLVPVMWAIAPNSVAIISSSGSVIGLRLGRATVSAKHASGLSAAAHLDVVRNPAIPISASANLAGTWEGQYVVDVCVRVSGEGPSTCRFILGSREPIRLELSQSEGRLTGRLALGTLLTGDVTGWQDALTRHVLFGTLVDTEDKGRTFEITKWDAHLDDGLTGTFEGVERFTSSAGGPQIYLRGGTFTGFQRVSGGTE